MGCINSSEIHPNIYRVVNVDSDGIALWSGTLEISPRELTLYRKGKEPTKWALQHLRRYGFDADLFTFEAGRRCTTGEGIYAFRCRRAESLFHLLQSYIQGIATHDDNTSTGLQLNDFSINNQQQSFSGHMNAATSALTQQTNSNNNNNGQQSQNTNYVMPANRNWNNGVQPMSGFARSTDTLTGDYLDPTPIGHTLNYRHSAGMRLNSISSGGGGINNANGVPISPGEPNSPGSPNSFNVILEVTQLNEHHHQAYQNSNLYQEFPLRSNEHTSLLQKKLSLDIPPQEPAPAINSNQLGTITTTSNTSICKTNNDSNEMMSPISISALDTNNDHPYVNVTPGEIDSLIGTPTTTQVNFTLARLSSTTYSYDPATRCYENLDLGAPTSSAKTTVLAQPPIILPSHVTRLKRFSKPDIFAKIDLPSMNSSSIDNSEPSTPTSISSTNCGGGGSGGNIAGGSSSSSGITTTITTKDNRKVNYIILDLDQSPSSSNIVSNNSAAATAPAAAQSSATVSSSLSNNSSDNTNIADILQQTTTTSSSSSNTINTQNNNTNLLNKLTSPTSSSAPSGNILSNSSIISTTANLSQITTNLFPPESPKKSALGYATIDFNKTAALSNSTAPTLDDSEGFRKTRHSLSVRQSNSISE